MNHVKIAILTVSVIALGSAKAYPFGGEHGPIGRTSMRADASPTLRKLIDHRDRVYGYFVNREDLFFYRGDTDTLNQFLNQFATLEGTLLKASINQSLTHASRPYNKPGKKIAVNWQLYSAPFDVHAYVMAVRTDDRDLEAVRTKWKEIIDGPAIARVELRIGDEIELDKLTIPPQIELTVIDDEQNTSQSIKEFVARYEKLRTKRTTQ